MSSNYNHDINKVKQDLIRYISAIDEITCVNNIKKIRQVAQDIMRADDDSITVAEWRYRWKNLELSSSQLFEHSNKM